MSKFRKRQAHAKHIIRKEYEHIKPVKGEDLNIENMTVRILKYCWFNVERFPTVVDISLVTMLGERTIYRYVDTYRWPDRVSIKQDNRLVKRALQETKT